MPSVQFTGLSSVVWCHLYI